MAYTSFDVTHAFRDFSTSFSHSFVDPDEDKGDTCSLACCGFLQAHRNHYLLFGGVPSLFALKFTVFVVIPAFSLAAGLNLIFSPSRQEFFAGVALLSVATLYLCVQLIKKTRDQIAMRREVLRRKYDILHKITMVDRGPAYNPYYYDGDVEYHMAQTYCDLTCAHTPCGCYDGDIVFQELEAPLPDDLCDFMWQLLMSCCCESSCNRFLQFCGICGLAQESRDIDQMFPPHRRVFDYVTMQPVLEYYSYILVARADQKKKIFNCFLSLSSLSRNILQSYLLCGGAIALFCYLFEVWLTHFTMILIVFLVANIFLWAVYFCFTNLILSEDAVIKGFASGFYIAGTMAVPFLALVLLLSEVAMYFSVEYSVDFDGHFWNGYSMRGNGSEFYTPWKTASGFMLSKNHPIAFMCFSFCQCLLVAFIQELAKNLAFRVIADHPDFWSRTDLEKIIHKTEFNEPVSNLDLESLPNIEVKTHVRPLRSRCCAIVVAVMSVSVGFACFENVFYACVFYYIDVTWYDVLARCLLLAAAPVSAVFQAIGFCRGSLELKVHIKTGSIIGSAVIFHGLFDFAVLVGDYIAEADFREDYLKFGSRAVIPFAIVVLGSCWVATSLFFLNRRLDGQDTNTIDVRNTWNWNTQNWMTDGFNGDATAKEKALPRAPSENDLSHAPSETSSDSSSSDDGKSSNSSNDTTGKERKSGDGTCENDDESHTSTHEERWINLTKSLDDVLRDARKSATINRPGTWDADENAKIPAIRRGYTPPGKMS